MQNGRRSLRGAGDGSLPGDLWERRGSGALGDLEELSGVCYVWLRSCRREAPSAGAEPGFVAVQFWTSETGVGDMQLGLPWLKL